MPDLLANSKGAVGIDLTYEGIATHNPISKAMQGILVGIDLTYEGIATNLNLFRPLEFYLVGIDLTYEGIATQKAHSTRFASIGSLE